jgi:two-component system chemotaxis response regulator CheB
MLCVLAVEDNDLNGKLLVHTLQSAGYMVVWERDGQEALRHFEAALHTAQPFDVVLTDWLLPGLDGPDLLRNIWDTCRRHEALRPLSVIVTILDTPTAKEHALQLLGADDFIAKPYQPATLLHQLDVLLRRSRQKLPPLAPTPAGLNVVHPAGPEMSAKATAETRSTTKQPPLPSLVTLAASTGGVDALRTLLKHIEAQIGPREQRASKPSTAWLVVQHGPAWMLETLCQTLQRETTAWDVQLGSNGQRVEAGQLYIAPGEAHLVLDGQGYLHLSPTAPVNHVCPAADVLFQSVAEGRQAGDGAKDTVAVVLTGLGCDGALGAKAIVQAGGRVLVQQPQSCVAPFMPKSVLELGLPRCEALSLEAMAARLATMAQ